MARKSSNIAKLHEMVASLTGLVIDVQNEMAGYMEDAEKYRDLKPMLNKIASRTAIPKTTDRQAGEEMTGHHDSDDNTQNTSGQDTPPIEKKRRGRKSSGESDGQEPNGNSGQ
jgi:hypothetical protein